MSELLEAKQALTTKLEKASRELLDPVTLHHSHPDKGELAFNVKLHNIRYDLNLAIKELDGEDLEIVQHIIDTFDADDYIWGEYGYVQEKQVYLGDALDKDYSAEFDPHTHALLSLYATTCEGFSGRSGGYVVIKLNSLLNPESGDANWFDPDSWCYHDYELEDISIEDLEHDLQYLNKLGTDIAQIADAIQLFCKDTCKYAQDSLNGGVSDLYCELVSEKTQREKEIEIAQRILSNVGSYDLQALAELKSENITAGVKAILS